jgi:hypothetical protein
MTANVGEYLFKKCNKRCSKKQPPELFFETFIEAHQIGI